MRDMTIIGGGLSGLAAAYELERLRIPYTLVEVRKRLGGSLISERRDGFGGCGAFVIDGGVMAAPHRGDWSFLDELGLGDSLIPASNGAVVFKDGTGALVEALAKRLTGTIMTRMAVSSVGRLGDRFGVCLENGLMLDARALIVAAPARYAAHMLYSLQPEVAERLMGYLYDTIVRVSLGYRREEVQLPTVLPPDMAFAFCHWTDSPHRAPPGHVLVQLGLRVKLDANPLAEWLPPVLEQLHWPANPLVMAAHVWPEADPLTCYHPGHAENMAAIEALLPEGAALAGSDYANGAFDLAARVNQGRAAARKVARWLGRQA